MIVYIRPLCEKDALKSCEWRNDPEIWIYTGSRPNRYITEQIELEWIHKVLNDDTSRRFAICIVGTDEYIGNVQLTNIENDSAEFHIFIGNKSYWGKGVSTAATRLVLSFARSCLNLKRVYLEVHEKNIAAIKSYRKNEFEIVSVSGSMVRMEINLS